MVSIAKKLFLKTRYTLELVKFSHTLFALPFALVGMLYANRQFPTITLFLKIILCMVLARTCAMAFNRWVDAKFDAQNPRTQNRHLPAGLLSKSYVVLLCVITALLFMVTTFFINPLSFYLAPLALFIICFYSLTKRFTHLTQIFLGLSLGIAPIAAWIAIKGMIELPPLILGLGVVFWVAGFDIIYSTQDFHFDQQTGLKSLVVKLGSQRALQLAAVFHVLFFITLLVFAKLVILSWIGWVGTLLVGMIILAEHFMIDLNNPTKINAAFFTANGLLSVVYLLSLCADLIFNLQ